MPGYGKLSQTTEDTVEVSSNCDTDESQSQCWGSGDMGLWAAVVILIILWTIGIWGGWMCVSKSNCKEDKCDGFGAGAFGAGLLWLIVIVLFIGAAYRCKWGAVVGLLVLFLILILIGMWWWSSC